jgi:putative FmdB family regulatory protein
MPLFEYICSDCGAHYSKLVLNRDNEPTACFYCDGKIRKVIQPASLRFIGEGWTEKGDRRED